jgi:hypothetical protein
MTSDALTETEVIVARRRDLEQFAIEDPDVAQQLWHFTAAQLERATAIFYR